MAAMKGEYSNSCLETGSMAHCGLEGIAREPDPFPRRKKGVDRVGGQLGSTFPSTLKPAMEDSSTLNPSNGR